MTKHSGVFCDMLEVAEDDDAVAEVPMAESSEVLERLLPFCLLDKARHSSLSDARIGRS